MIVFLNYSVLLKKTKIISDAGKQEITTLIVDILLPCNIISSFYIPMDGSVIRNGLLNKKIKIEEVILQGGH